MKNCIMECTRGRLFTYGEYGKDMNSKSLFHSTDCSWATLKGK
ncbi:MAG: hypothetical protein WDO19_19310 [Bacteroidota bacterium]